MAWYDAPITNPHPPDDGVDLGTNNDTPVWFPYAGTVIDSEYYVYGGQVAVDTGQGFIEYFIHLDQLRVQPGEHVEPGQIVGTTGGGLGDLLLHDGVVQPAQDQSWYEGHSTGYHTEYGEFVGSTFQDFNQGWHNPPRQLDPTPVIEALRSGAPVPGAGDTANVVLDPTLQTSQAGGGDPWQGFPPGFDHVMQGIFGVTGAASQMNPSGWARAIAGGITGGVGGVLQGILNALGFTNLKNFLLRWMTGMVGASLIALGLLILVWPLLRRDDRSLDEAVKALASRAG